MVGPVWVAESMLARHDEASSKYAYKYEASFEYEENTGEASKAEWNKKRELPAGCERIVSDKGAPSTRSEYN